MVWMKVVHLVVSMADLKAELTVGLLDGLKVVLMDERSAALMDEKMVAKMAGEMAVWLVVMTVVKMAEATDEQMVV